ncbi:unnamed protein product [Calicophoron daubneyi]|uniref:HSA domain-containing protein n=1 Tax=Calicophoron daubneyi TaxID=300641 RepID=A0AAV2T9L0_CALDB
MLCDPNDSQTPPVKKPRGMHDYDLPLSPEEVGTVCAFRNEKVRLDLIAQELDSLDDPELLSHTACFLTGNSTDAGAVSRQVPPLADLYSMADRKSSTQYYLYFPPRASPRPSSPAQELVISQANGHKPRKGCSICPEIAQDARREATVLQRVSLLRRQGLWSANRLPKVMEPKCESTFHEFLLSEATWMSVDFTEERKWKKRIAFELAKAAQTYLLLRQEWNRQCQLTEQRVKMRNAGFVSRLVKDWWDKVKQDIRDSQKFADRLYWSCLMNQNSYLLTQCSDTYPAWMANVEYGFYSDENKSEIPGVLSKRLSGDQKVLREVDSDVDDDWYPRMTSGDSDEDTCSRSTSSSRAASFVDESDTSGLGISELPVAIDCANDFPCARSSVSDTLLDRSTSDLLGASRKHTSAGRDMAESPLEEITGSENTELVENGTSQDISLPNDKNAGSFEEERDSVDAAEVEVLMSEVHLPLDMVLKSYTEQGWEPLRSEFNRGSTDFQSSTTAHPDCAQFEPQTTSDIVQRELTELRTEAEIPLEHILPSGYVASHYLKQSGEAVEPCVDSGVEKTRVVDSADSDIFSPHPSSDSGKDDEESEVAEIYSGDSDSFGRSMPCLDPGRNMVEPPWFVNSPSSNETNRPEDVHRAALELAPLLKGFHANVDGVGPGLTTTAYSPAFRVGILPSSNVGAAVTWLRHAFERTVPGLLLSPSLISGDAELAIAAHLGQLIIPSDSSYISHALSPEIRPTTGNWGPHLIVAPRLCLPAWRSRLSNWCPGLKMVCLGLGSHGSANVIEPAGTGRRLRSSVARGAVNICLTSYAAIRARPSRYSRIQWSVVVFDQVHHLLRAPGTSAPASEQLLVEPNVSDGNVSSSTMAFQTGLNVPTAPLNTEMRRPMKWTEIEKCDEERPSLYCEPSARTTSKREVTGLDVFTSALKFSGHRVLISSSSDLLSPVCGYRLFELSKLLLLREPEGTESYEAWLSDLFCAAGASRWRRMSEPSDRNRPSKKQMLKFLDPFVVRLEEDDEWEACVDEVVVECPMTAVQRRLHDAVLTTRAAHNALKTGDLLDLLQTVSLASRICSHPCLIENPPQSSRAFASILTDLSDRSKPVPGPFVFRNLGRAGTGVHSGLDFDTPEAVLLAVRELRHSGLSDSVNQCYRLADVLKPPAHVRSRIAELAARRDQLLSVLACQDNRLRTSPPKVSTPVSWNAGHVDNHHANGSDSINGQNGSDLFDGICPKLNAHLQNGLPDTTDGSEKASSLVHLDFTSIPVRGKRPRATSGLNSLNSSLQSIKRRRIDGDRTLSDGFCISDSAHILSNDDGKRPISVCSSSFLGPELLSILEKEFLRKPDACRGLRGNKRLRRSSSPRRGTANRSFANGQPIVESTINGTGFGHASPRASSPRAESLIRYNNLHCQHFTGFSDWCSAATCELFNFTGHSSLSAGYHSGWSSPSSRHPSSTALPLWSVVSHYVSRIPYEGLLCTRSRAIASPPRSRMQITRSVSRWLLSTFQESDDGVLIGQHALFPKWSSSHPLLTRIGDDLLQINRLLHPLTERSRWLSKDLPSSLRNWHTSLPALDDSVSSPMGRLFSESGKFCRLNQLLREFLGAKSVNETFPSRPRCIYLLAHQAAFLDLLEGFLTISPWRHCSRLRLPLDYRSIDASSGSLVDRINAWPHGSLGPLLVLIHSRSPAAYLAGLRAGADTAVVVCDVDWRADVTDDLRALFHSWYLNGLTDILRKSDHPHNPRPPLHVYRLVSMADVGCSNLCSSVEACLSRGVACRLLPGAVFQAHSASSVGGRSCLSARVQPNVVNELLSNRPLYRPIDRRPLSIKCPLRETIGDRGSPWTIKQECPSYSSASSVTSSFSCHTSERMKEDRMRDDDSTTFQEREPLGEHLLNRALELFEDPTDTQVWCYATAESLAMAEDTQGDRLLRDEPDFCGSLLTSLGDTVKLDRFALDIEPDLSATRSPPSIEKQLGYTKNTSWEVAHYELLDYLTYLEDRVLEKNDTFCYDSGYLSSNVGDAGYGLERIYADDCHLSPLELSSFEDLPIWEPFVPYPAVAEGSSAELQKTIPVISSSDATYSHPSMLSVNGFTDISLSDLNAKDDSDWGYESEPMSEQELPPVTYPVSTIPSPVPSYVPTTGQTMKLDDSTCSVPTAVEPTTDSAPHSSSFSSGVRGPQSGPSLKRRKLAGSAALSSRKAGSAANISSSSSIADEANESPISLGTIDSAVVPSPNAPTSRTVPRDSQMVTAATTSTAPVTPPSGNTTSISANSAVLGAGIGGYGGNTILLSLHQVTSTGGSGPKLHIPRATYNREISSARTNRLRRSGTIPTSSTGNAAAVAAIAAGAHLSQSQLSKTPPYHSPVQQPSSTGLNFSNSALIARYGHTSPVPSHLGATGRHPYSSQNLTTSLSTPARYNLGPNVGSAQNILPSHSQSSAIVSNINLYVGKPQEWLPHEEAALYQCIVKVQDLALEPATSGTSGSGSPNFRLAEFFVNNFFPCRGYRGARQCLLMHSKMQTVAGLATSAIATNGLNYPQSSVVPPVGGSHGPTGRKVKSKLKSVAAAAASANLCSSQAGSFPSASSTGSSPTNTGADTATAVSRYRNYLCYQYLSSRANASMPGGSEAEPQNSDTVNALLPPQLAPLFNAMRLMEDSQVRLVRKAVRDSLLPTPVIPASQPYRSTSSRRSGIGIGSSASVTGSSGVQYLQGSSHSGAGGSMGSTYGHLAQHGHSASSVSFSPLSHGHLGHVPAAPALLTHHRHHRHHPNFEQGQSTIGVPPPLDVGGSTPASTLCCTTATATTTTVTHSGPMIQKNPTHIAALQEHNINPDTLITPAMVIKNKEEREARLRAEALAAANQCNTSTVPTTASTASSTAASVLSVFHQTQSSLHHHPGVQEAVHHPGGQLSASMDSASSGNAVIATTSLPLSLTGTHLSLSHTGGQRSASIMLPVRCGFGSHALPSASTIISLPHSGGPRVLGPATPASPLSSGHVLSHQPKHHLVNSTVGRLTQYSTGGSIDLVGPVTSSHVLPAAAIISASSDSENHSGMEMGPNSIIVPNNWRSTSIARTIGLQTIVSSPTTAMLRRSTTFTSVGLANQFQEGSLNSRMSSFQSTQSQGSAVGSVTATYLNTQSSKNPVPTGYFIQQRPQLLFNTQPQTSLPRGTFTALSGVSSTAGISAASGCATPITPLPQILRPRSALRGSVIQPAFVRTISTTGGSNFPVGTSQIGSRLPTGNSNLLHGRVTLAVSSGNPVSSILSSRNITSPGIRTQPPTNTQQVRPAAGSLGNISAVPSVHSGQSAGGDQRHFISQYQGLPVQQSATVSIASSPSVISSSNRNIDPGTSRQSSDSDPFVLSRFRPQQQQ